MSLFSSIQMAGNTLRANEIALQVVGQNIANANTPGYIREEVQFAPATTQRYGGLLLGLGVEVEAVVQKLDEFLEQRLRGSVSERAGAETLQEAYGQLEGLIGELGDTDLSTAMNNFFSSISEILNQPESRAVRNLAVLQGDTLARNIVRMSERASEIRRALNGRIENMTDDINRLVEEIRTLNVRIAETEGGDISNSDAVGLRDQRLRALEDLAGLIDIRVAEQRSGGVAVYRGGDFLVFEGIARKVETVLSSDRGLTVADIQLASTGAPLDPVSGQLRGLLDARDEVLGHFLDQLDDLACTLAHEFNKLFSSGQGLNGFSSVTGTSPVDDVDLPLSEAGLRLTPQNGSFQIQVYNKKTGSTKTTDIFVDLNGMGDDDTTLADLRDAINARVDGVTAAITTGHELSLTVDSPDQTFAFANDTGGILAALGVNTFFTGYSARNLGINQVVRDDPGKFTASRDGIGLDTEVAIDLAAFLDRPLESQNGASLGVLYDWMTGETTQNSAVARSVCEGAQVFETTLRGQKMSISGVNIDEEAVKMIAFQRAYQASARFISALAELFEILVNI
jgi:flagellar hook-associated protein 1 FlgK